MKKALAYVLIMVFALAASTTLFAYTPQNVPNPKNAYQDNFVSNPDGILTAQAEAQINEIARDLRKSAEVELAVVAIREMEAEFFGDEVDFCQKLFNLWGIGGKKNQGVLIFLETTVRAIRIHTGGGLEGLLPDAVCDEIIQDVMIPELREDYSKGMLAGVKAIEERLTTPDALAELLLDGYHPQEQSDIYDYLIFSVFVTWLLALLAIWQLYSRPGASNNVLYGQLRGIEILLWISCIFFAVPGLFLALWFHNKRRRIRTRPLLCPHCSRKMTLLSEKEEDEYLSTGQQAEENVHSVDYDVWHCTNCGNNIILPYTKPQLKYTACPRCTAKTYYMHADVVLKQPTQLRSGLGEKTHKCKHCGYARTEQYVIPKLPIVVAGGSGRGGSGGGFSGGSWGGGVSFGGGASGRF